ncbi:MAG: hypothetical protein AAFP84_14965 [Actinomycetota bacterium]
MTRRLVGWLAPAAVALAACGAGSSDTDDAAAQPRVTESESAPASDAEPTTDAPAADASTEADEPDAAVEAPDILRFSSALVGGGELDAASTAGTPTAFWFWSPT